MYRLLADILNDIAFILDCLSPAFPKPIRVVILSFSSVLRALCGVAAGSAKASLSAHFARWGNLGELNAKDGSQETVISLFGMLVGSLVVSWVTTPIATWTTLIFLLSLHLETNRRAVRAVSMRTLNRQRATIVFHQLRQGHVPTPDQVSRQERIFERDGVLRGSNGTAYGYCNVGATMSSLLAAFGSTSKATNATLLHDESLSHLLSIYNDRAYILWSSKTNRQIHLNITLKTEAKAGDVLTAWWHALLVGEHLNGTAQSEKSSRSVDQTTQLDPLERTISGADELWRKYNSELKNAGWDLGIGALETMSSTRISIDK